MRTAAVPVLLRAAVAAAPVLDSAYLTAGFFSLHQLDQLVAELELSP